MGTNNGELGPKPGPETSVMSCLSLVSALEGLFKDTSDTRLDEMLDDDDDKVVAVSVVGVSTTKGDSSGEIFMMNAAM